MAWGSQGVAAGDDGHRSMRMLAFVPVALIVGFVAGSILLGDPNTTGSPRRWNAVGRVVTLWLAVEVPAGLGVFWGWRAMRAGDPLGRKGLIANAVVFAALTLTTLVGGTVDALN